MKGPFGHAFASVPAERVPVFWSKVDRSGDCWLWTGSADVGGYGVFKAGPTMVRAHRASWVMANGPLAAGELVLHSCDTRRCVRPAHLFLGTQLQNVLDMVAKGRHGRGYHVKVRGQDHHSAKLTDDQVEAIRVLRRAGWNQELLGEVFGVSRAWIGLIVRGQKRA